MIMNAMDPNTPAQEMPFQWHIERIRSALARIDKMMQLAAPEQVIQGELRIIEKFTATAKVAAEREFDKAPYIHLPKGD
jgi:hypothetical protein